KNIKFERKFQKMRSLFIGILCIAFILIVSGPTTCVGRIVLPPSNVCIGSCNGDCAKECITRGFHGGSCFPMCCCTKN
ncbi:hypothetical protein VIGAN_04134900, partial [Vigna angularis var. angularis]